jgi:signal transduction histidine kinase
MKLDAAPFSAPLRWPLALLLAGLAASTVVGLWRHQANAAEVSAQPAATAERTAQRLYLRPQRYENGVLAARSAVVTAGEVVDELTREQFQRYGTSLDLPRQLPGVSGVAFIRRVAPAQEAAFVEGMRREGFAGFRIRQLGPNPGDRFVIQYVAPMLDPNAPMLGLDIASAPARREAALAAVASGEPPFDTVCLDRHGDAVDVSASVAGIRDEEGCLVGMATTLRDMRAQRSAQARIEELNATLERQVRLRTAELRAILHSAATAIIATDLTGRVTAFNPAAEAMLRLQAAPGLPVRLRGDAKRLRQMLLHLLDNAVKFTETGEVVPRVEAEALEARRVRLRLEVSDTGIGIAPAAQQRIFEPFAQGDDSSTRHFGGTGLGLSIVRRLVALMGGELRLDSAPGRGSRFVVTVELDVEDAA